MDRSQQIANESTTILSKQQEQSSQLKDTECSQQQSNSLKSDNFVNFEEQQIACSNSEHSRALQEENEGVLAADNSKQRLNNTSTIRLPSTTGQLIVSKEPDIFYDSNNVDEGTNSLVYDNQAFNLSSELQESQAVIKEAEIDLHGSSSDTTSPIPCCIRKVVTEPPEKKSSESDLSDFEDFKYKKRHMSKSIFDIELPESDEIRETLELLNFNRTFRKSSSYSEIVSESEDEPIVTRFPAKHKLKPRASDSAELTDSPQRVLTRNRFGYSSTEGNYNQIIGDIIAENIVKIKSYKIRRAANSNKLNEKCKMNTGEAKTKYNMESKSIDQRNAAVQNTGGYIQQNSNRIINKKPLLIKNNQPITEISTRSKREILPSSVRSRMHSKLSLKKKKHGLVIEGKSLSNTTVKSIKTMKKGKIALAATKTKQFNTGTTLGRTRSGRFEILPSTTRNGTLYELSLKKENTALVMPKIRGRSTVGPVRSANMLSVKRENINTRMRTTRNTTIYKIVRRSIRDNIGTRKMTRSRFMAVTQKGKADENFMTPLEKKTDPSTASNSSNVSVSATTKIPKRTSCRLAKLLRNKQNSLFAGERGRIGLKDTTNPYKLIRTSIGTSDVSKGKARPEHMMLLRKKKRESSSIRNIVINSKPTTSNGDTNTMQNKIKTRTSSKTKRKHIDVIKKKSVMASKTKMLTRTPNTGRRNIDRPSILP